jgi:hypothetical protein
VQEQSADFTGQPREVAAYQTTLKQHHHWTSLLASKFFLGNKMVFSNLEFTAFQTGFNLMEISATLDLDEISFSSVSPF